jgi:hypothetical protein
MGLGKDDRGAGMKSYDVYISHGTDPVEGEIWGNAIAHFEEMGRAQEFVEKLKDAGERAKWEASDLPELPPEEQAKKFSDHLEMSDEKQEVAGVPLHVVRE